MPASSITIPHQTTPRPSLPDTIESALQLAARTLGARLIMLTRIDGNTSTVTGVVDRLDTVRPGTVFPLEDTFCLHLLRTGETTIGDTDEASPGVQRIPAALELDVRAYLGVPVRFGNGEIFGTFCAYDSRPRQWTGEDLRTLSLLARLLGFELEGDRQRRRADRGGHSAHEVQLTDEQTGLIARPAFENQLRLEERRLRHGGGLYSVAMLEINELVEIEQAQGSLAGEHLIQGFANTLMLSSRLVDCCARLGAGRFAVLFPETPAKNVPAWQRRFDTGLDTWNLLHRALGAALTYAIGVAESEEGDDYQSVLALATERMHSAMFRHGRRNCEHAFVI
jgi:diguanylate cyclase